MFPPVSFLKKTSKNLIFYLVFLFSFLPYCRETEAQETTPTFLADVPFICAIQNHSPNIDMAYEPVNQEYSQLVARPLDNLSISSNGLIDVSLELISHSGLEVQRTELYLLIEEAFSKLYEDNSLTFQAPSPRVPYDVANSGTGFGTWLVARVGIEPSDYQFVVRVTCLQHTE
jgi:hypothetical protein